MVAENRDFLQRPYRVLYETWGIFVYGNSAETVGWLLFFTKIMQDPCTGHCTDNAASRMVPGVHVLHQAGDDLQKREDSVSDTCLGARRGHRASSSADLSGNVKMAAVAGVDIPPGTLSSDISATNPMDINTVFWNDHDIDYFVEVTLDEGKMLTSTLNNDWMKHVRLARHCHMQNMQIILTNTGSLCLQSTNTIKKGEPLYAWFALETAKSFEIPFLNLNNIKGGHHYSCHNCGKVFEDPNPLKIHIALLCPVSSLKSPYNTNGEQRVNATSVHHGTFRSQIPSGPIRPPASLGNLSWAVGNHSAFRPLKKQNGGPICQRTSNESPLFHQSNPKFAISALPNFPIDYGALSDVHLTAFQNFRPSLVPGTCLSYFQLSPAIDGNANLTSASNMLGYHHTLPTSSFKYLHNASGASPHSGGPAAVSFSANSSPNPSLVHDEMLSENEANIGGIVSEQFTTSDGKSKRRHKCLYCSKMYSRKYGLKIHIRTHLNYKPLSCKVCQRRFADPSNLNKHIRLHAEGVTPYRCDICGKVLVRRRDLERHLKSRHPQVDDVTETASTIKTESNCDDESHK